MSDYHIMAIDVYENTATVVMHIFVPDITNDVGVNYRAAIVEWQGDTTSVYPGTTSAEQSELDNGALYEHVTTITTAGPGESLTDKRNRFDAAYNDAVTAQQDRINSILRFWGYSRDVP